MQFLRKSAVAGAASLLTLFLGTFGILLSLHIVFSSPKGIEKALDSSGIYTNLVHNVLAQVQQQSSNVTENNLPLSQPQVQQAIATAFPPQLLKSSANNILEGTYPWLQGKTTAPTFSVDLTSAKANLANGIAAYSQTRLSSLPPCTPAQTLALDPNNIDALTVACVPAGFNTATAVDQVRQNILTGDFLHTPVLTANTIKGDDGRNVTQQFHAAPTVYQKATLAMWLHLVVIVTLVAVIIFLSKNRRAGIKRSAVVLLSVGITSIVVAVVASYVSDRLIDKVAGNTANHALQQKVIDVLTLLMHDVRMWWAVYGAVLTVLGAGALVALHFFKAPKTKDESTGEHPPKPPVAPAETAQ